ncbi:MAG TPA: MFS transporter [Actinomycetota bacterium]
MGPFANRDLRIIVVAYGLSSLGDYLALITLTLRVADLTDSGWAISGLLLAGLVPLVVLAPVAGYLVDRFETARVLTLTALAQTGIALLLVPLDSPAAILALFATLSAGFAITQPALFALTPVAVGEEKTTEANAYLEMARWGGATLGPLLAGWITATAGPDVALFGNAATFLMVALAVPLLRVRRPPSQVAEAGTRKGEMRRGITYLARDRTLALVAGAVALMVVFAAVDNVAEVFFARDVLGAGDVGYGALITAWTLGMVAGASGIGRRLPDRFLARAVLLGPVGGGAAIALAAAMPSVPLALAAFLVGGVANGVELVAMRSLIHRRAPEHLRGRVFAAYYGVVNAAQIAAMGLGGALMSAAGARASLLIGGLGTLAVGAGGLLLYAWAAARKRLDPATNPGYSTTDS